MNLPQYCIVENTPVKALSTEDGGMDILAYDWKTGQFCRDLRYTSRIVLGGTDVEQVDEERFNACVAALQAGLPLRQWEALQGDMRSVHVRLVLLFLPLLWIGEVAAPGPPHVASTSMAAIVFLVSLLLAAAALLVRRSVVRPAGEVLRNTPGAVAARARWRTGLWLAFTLALGVVALGTLLRASAAPLWQTVVLYVAGLVLLLALRPAPPRELLPGSVQPPSAL